MDIKCVVETINQSSFKRVIAVIVRAVGIAKPEVPNRKPIVKTSV